MLRRRNLISVLLVGVIASLVLALHYVLVSKQGNLIWTPRVVDALENIVPRENEEPHSLSAAENMFRLYDRVETFVLFIGYPRSSHSLVGAILDAHPEIIIPHEYNLLPAWNRFRGGNARRKNVQKYMLFNELHQMSARQALFGIRAKNSLLQGEFTYTYNVPGLWQGGYQKTIKVIGDKKGGSTSNFLKDPDKMNILEEIGQVVQVPIKFIHVTRNPFDNIATMFLRAMSQRNAVRGDKAEKVNNTKRLEGSIDFYFKLADANQRVRERYGDAVIDIPGHETVLRPKQTIQKLCDHLGVTCSEEYLEKCSKIMYGTPSITRDKIVWTDDQKTRVTEMIKNYPFLKDYSFDEYPV